MFARSISLPYGVALSAPCSMILQIIIGNNFFKCWALSLISGAACSHCWPLCNSVVIRCRVTERRRKCRRTELWNNLELIYRRENGQIRRQKLLLILMSRTTVFKKECQSVSTNSVKNCTLYVAGRKANCPVVFFPTWKIICFYKFSVLGTFTRHF